MSGKIKGTRTSRFGVSKREGHDSTYFYSRSLYNNLKVDKEWRRLKILYPLKY
ncbi:MAG: hypothetical protein QXX17_03270 [Conexivisphaerales archaeon]